MSGGEALLRPELVRHLATTSRAVGTRSALLSGMYFARSDRRIPTSILRAIASVDHFAASLDLYHEQEVSRSQVFRALHQIREYVPHVSLQLTGLASEDPYLDQLVADARAEFNDQVPMIVDHVGAAGRARDWIDVVPRPSTASAEPMPCLMAAWPLMHYDGSVFACCAQAFVAKARPPHLVLGVGADGWPALASRLKSSPLLRGIRVLGPQYLHDRFGDGVMAGADACTACRGLAERDGLAERVDDYWLTASGQALEAAARGIVGAAKGSDFVRMAGAPKFGQLVDLGGDAA